MKYTIYKTTCILSGKIYIGKHQTHDPNDSYLGSGKFLRRAIKKYGVEQFRKEILYVFDSKEEMDAKEKEIVTEEFIKRKDNYNAGVGGEGGPLFKGKRHSQTSIEKMQAWKKDTVKSFNAYQKMSKKQTGKKHSEKTIKKIAAAAAKRKMSEETKEKISKSLKGRSMSQETKDKISKSMKMRRSRLE